MMSKNKWYLSGLWKIGRSLSSSENGEGLSKQWEKHVLAWGQALGLFSMVGVVETDWENELSQLWRALHKCYGVGTFFCREQGTFRVFT